MTKWTKTMPAVGERVEIPPYLDTWMRGARFGTVHSVNVAERRLEPQPTLFRVRMDHPAIRSLVTCRADDCRSTGVRDDG